MERNYNCYCCQFWWDNQHYHKRNNHLLPIQTACQGVFWQRSKPIFTASCIDHLNNTVCESFTKIGNKCYCSSSNVESHLAVAAEVLSQEVVTQHKYPALQLS